MFLRKRKVTGSALLVIFALPFCAVSIFTGYKLLSTVVEWVKVSSWREVPAYITHADLEVHSDSDSTTKQVKARYRYHFEGKNYTGTRVSLHRGSDNIGSFQENVYQELEEHHRSGEAYRCFVNPDNPGESILIRKIRMEMLGIYLAFTVVFGGFGFGALFYGIYHRKKTKIRKQLESAHPGEPWLCREEWKDGIIKSSSKKMLILSIIFAVFWNAVSIPVSVLFFHEAVSEGFSAKLLIFLFPVIGLGLIIWAVKNILRFMKFGESTFEMDILPGIVGGPLAGVIRTKLPVKPANGFRIVLNCINRYTTGTGKSRSTHEKILWQDEYTAGDEDIRIDSSGSKIRVLFAIPFDARDTTNPDEKNRIFWRLEVEGDIPGVDYYASFEVPVYKTAESSPDFSLEEVESPDDEDIYAGLDKSGVIAQPLPGGGVRMVFPMARYKSTAMGLTLFFAGWSAVVYFLYVKEAPIFLSIVFGAFDLVIFYGVLSSWFDKGRVEAQKGRLLIKGGIFGLGAEKEIPASQITEIREKRGMQAGKKLFYRVEVTTNDGKNHTAAKRLNGLKQAKTLVRILEKSLFSAE